VQVGAIGGPVFPDHVTVAGDGQVGDRAERVVDPQVSVPIPGGDGESVADREEQFDDLREGLVGGAHRVVSAQLVRHCSLLIEVGTHFGNISREISKMSRDVKVIA
jgi:hypothetical protein